jgi:hypothetical protein
MLIGLTVIILCVLQLVAGSITLYKLRNFKSGEESHKFRVFHRVTGYALYIMTKINILIGTTSSYYDASGWLVFGILYFLLLIGSHIYIYISYNQSAKKFDENPVAVRESSNPIHIGILKALEEGKSRNEIVQAYPNTRWVIYGNRVYDVTNWIHPGGNFILGQVTGREISRFLHGAYGLESTNMSPYTHSSYALKLLDSFLIGKLKGVESVLTPKNPDANEKSTVLFN